MSDALYFGLWLLGCLTAWLFVSLFLGFVWARISANLAPQPQRTLADRMAAARGPVGDPVAEAIAITKEAAL